VFRLPGSGWRWFYIFWNFRNFSRVFSGQTFTFPTGSLVEVAIVSVGGFMAFVVMAITNQKPHDLEARLTADMRSIAQEPVPATNDPRFKKWNGLERLPAPA
jgi:hypothetical protein